MKNEREYYETIVEKVIMKTYDEFMEQIRYLFRFTNNGPIHIIHEYFDDRIHSIENKPVNELSKNERLLLMIHWAYENGGFDKFRSTPFNIIENLTDDEIVNEFNRRCKDPFHHVRIESVAVTRSDDK